MSLPDLIEIVPLNKPVRAEITVPGSKSITNRALILAALADGEVTLKGALWSEDTEIMFDCLQKLGFEVSKQNDPDEPCNRTIAVKGLGGKIPNAGTAEKPLELFVGNAGTAARFLSAFVCLGDGVYRLSGVPRMHERPQAALFQALRELGYRVESEKGNDRLPVKIFGGSSRGSEAQTEKESQSLLTSAATKHCKVSIEDSSQFASALLLSSRQGGWEIEIVGENAEESPYVAMTAKLMEVFPKNGGTFQIEPDASSGSYFWAAGQIAPWAEDFPNLPELKLSLPEPFRLGHVVHGNFDIEVLNWPKTGWQIDENFPQVISLGETHRLILEAKKSGNLSVELPKLVKKSFKTAIISRKLDLGDSIMTAIVLSSTDLLACSVETNQFTDLGRLRVQECERVIALRTELTKCGAKVVEKGDTLTVWPSSLHGAEIETYNDHRMAMCFAILGLKVPGIKIKNPACVKKTFPNFFQKLAAQPPHGLGAEIRDAKTGRKLAVEELFAD
ncbi:MAG: 3-phosphoshikimate 1-carboxyvinyltransferase [Verrucomicrobiales bacterium]|nr:3-phosphoshikimate 1-carboxyvinyltransferase [Verrucomicrobiales bacterium]